MPAGFVRPYLLNAVGPSGFTALGLAALLGRDDLLLALLAHGADVHGRDVLDSTALHWAAISGDRNVSALLQDHAADRTRRNLLGGSAAHYEAAWQVKPPKEFEVHVELRDGSREIIRHAERFTEVLGLEYMPAVRPGVDFFMSILHGRATPAWSTSLRAELTAFEPFPFDTLVEAPLLFKDFGAPLNWGVCVRESLPAFMPITTYSGDLIHSHETIVQFFEGSANAYVCAAQPSPTLLELLPRPIDAEKAGGFGGRINSMPSRDATNLDSASRFWHGLPLNLFYAKRPLQAGEQIGWYYGDSYWPMHDVAPAPLGPSASV